MTAEQLEKQETGTGWEREQEQETAAVRYPTATYLELQKEELKPAQALCIASSLHLASMFILEVNNSNSRLPISGPCSSICRNICVTCLGCFMVESSSTLLESKSTTCLSITRMRASGHGISDLCSKFPVPVPVPSHFPFPAFPFTLQTLQSLKCDWLTDISKGVDETYPQQKLRMISKQISRLLDQQRFIFLALIKKDMPIVLLKEYAPTGPEGLLPASIYYIC